MLVEAATWESVLQSSSTWKEAFGVVHPTYQKGMRRVRDFGTVNDPSSFWDMNVRKSMVYMLLSLFKPNIIYFTNVLGFYGVKFFYLESVSSQLTQI